MLSATSYELPITTLSASKLHEMAIESFRIGNRGRLSLCDALRVLADTRLYHELGHPSITAYAEAHFQLRRSETLESIRVARALQDLTRIREAFAEGRLGWSVVKAITRVASEETEQIWLRFASEHTLEQTLAEVRDARRKNRDRPREDRFGLPNLDERLVLRFSRSEMEKIRIGLSRIGEEIAERTDGEEVTPEQVLLYLCERLMERGPKHLEDDARSDVARKYALVYHACPECRRTALQTAAGLVEVDHGDVERIEGDANVERISSDRTLAVRHRPTPLSMRRKIMLRESGRCANPRCDHRADHCHHILFRSEGGETVLANEVALCATCHALIHAGLLRVEGRAGDKLRWSTPGETMTARIREAASGANKLPVLRLESANADSIVRAASTNLAKSADADSRFPDLDLLATALIRHGASKQRSRALVQRACESLAPALRTEEAILRKAFSLW